MVSAQQVVPSPGSSPVLRTSLREELVAEFLTPSRTFPSAWLESFQPQPPELKVPVTTLPQAEDRVQLVFKRAGLDGRTVGLEERISFPELSGGLSVTRKMGPTKDRVRGRAGRMPFTPGGLDISSSQPKELHRSADGLLDQAPGLSRGVDLEVNRPLAGAATDGVMDIIDEGYSERDNNSEDENLSGETSPEESKSISKVTGAVQDLTLDLPDSTEEFGSVDYLLPSGISFMRQTKSATQDSRKQWAHMVDINQRFDNFAELVPFPARTWPFELDVFQKEAVFHLEQGDSVFVAAHTSAGKTVVAEYAMSMALKHMTKCIYTSPIKALSNQKYRDFTREYEDVGILTGDVQLNPEASTLIMTTEVLRSMLYRGADIIRDVEFVIFDEVHYVNDSERGVVWEEVIIMLPDHVKLILLSATVPNTFEFANWVGRTKEKDVYVIATPQRPVPLKHYLWSRKKLFEIVDDKRQFSEKGWRALSEQLNPPPPPASNVARGGRGGSRGGSAANRGGRGGGATRGSSKTSGPQRSGQTVMQKHLGHQAGKYNTSSPTKQILLELFSYLRSNQLLPAVVFVFSRKMTEQHAMSLRSLDFNTGREKAEVYMFMDRATSRLRREDRDLPQIMMLREFLTRGIGVHHSGLLPIMKEVVEILFARGLVKILFATETFAMGLNLPTRTVVFTAIHKFDSKHMRSLLPGEYTQMAGRAGRRGIDKEGTVIILNNGSDPIPQTELRQMILGTPTKLSSQFRLTYVMILSLLRIEAVRVEDVIQQSFSENASHVLRPERERESLEMERQLAAVRSKFVDIPRFEELIKLWEACQSLHHLQTIVYDTAILLKNLLGHWCVFQSSSGRCVGIIQSRSRNGVTIVTLTPPLIGSKSESTVGFPYAVDPSIPENLGSELFYNQVPVSAIELISQRRVRLQLLPTSKEEEVAALRQMFLDALHDGSLGEEITTLNTLRAPDARQALEERAAIMRDLHIPTNPPTIEEWQLVSAAGTLESRIAQLKASASTQNTELLPDYEQRLAVLRQANYVDENQNILLKGRVACEISTGYELYITELILDNFFGPYEPEEIVALLSAFVFEGARGVDDSGINVTPRLEEGRIRVLEIVDFVHDLAEQHQVQITQDEAEFAEKGRFALMQVVYEWARGMSFSEITSLTEVQEGLIVRVINRLDEVCRSVMSASRIIGDVDLYQKVALAQERIKRDIVFCSSLYL